MQQFLASQANTMSFYENFYGFPLYAGPVYQDTAQQYQHQYWAPSSGPSRTTNQYEGFRQAEALRQNHRTHESFGMTAEDHSTGIHPGHARMGAINNTGVGKV
jgi:hypothetical protein